MKNIVSYFTTVTKKIFLLTKLLSYCWQKYHHRRRHRRRRHCKPISYHSDTVD